MIIKDGVVKAQKDVLNSTSQVLTLKLKMLQTLQTSVSSIYAPVLLNKWMSE